MKLLEAQFLFSELVPKLLTKAFELGFEVTIGDAYRDPRVFGRYGEHSVAYGADRSNHKLRLAIDLNLFLDGEWLPDTSAHRELGVYWESLHEQCRWGGRFNDGNHYEVVWKK